MSPSCLAGPFLDSTKSILGSCHPPNVNCRRVASRLGVHSICVANCNIARQGLQYLGSRLRLIQLLIQPISISASSKTSHSSLQTHLIAPRGWTRAWFGDMRGWPLAAAQTSLVKPILCMPSFWDEPRIYYDWSTRADLESICWGWFGAIA